MLIWLKENWDEQKKLISQAPMGLTSHLKRENYLLPEASVNWKFVTFVLDILGLFLSPSRRLMFSCCFVAVSFNTHNSLRGGNACR